MNEVEELLVCIRDEMDLDGETEHEVLTEIRDHLEEAVAEARSQGRDEAEVMAEIAARFGLGEEIARELRAAHAGWGTAEAVLAAGMPVVCALLLRWLLFAPDGTALGWSQVLSRPVFWAVSLAALLIPMTCFDRWRHALAGWVVFWGLTVMFFIWPSLPW